MDTKCIVRRRPRKCDPVEDTCYGRGVHHIPVHTVFRRGACQWQTAPPPLLLGVFSVYYRNKCIQKWWQRKRGKMHDSRCLARGAWHRMPGTRCRAADAWHRCLARDRCMAADAWHEMPGTGCQARPGTRCHAPGACCTTRFMISVVSVSPSYMAIRLSAVSSCMSPCLGACPTGKAAGEAPPGPSKVAGAQAPLP